MKKGFRNIYSGCSKEDAKNSMATNTINRTPRTCGNAKLAIDSQKTIGTFFEHSTRTRTSKALVKRSRLFTIQRSTCMLSEMSRAFGHLVE